MVEYTIERFEKVTDLKYFYENYVDFEFTVGNVQSAVVMM